MKALKPNLMICHVLFRPLQSVNKAVVPPNEFEFRRLDADELMSVFAQDPNTHLDETFVQDALTKGDLCVGAFRENELVAYVWRAFGRTPHNTDVDVEVNAPYWYTYKMLTLPQARGHNLGGRLTLYADTFCQDAKCIGGVGFVETHNRASLRTNLKVGTQKVGFAGYLKCFGRVITFNSPGAIAHQFRFKQRNVR